MSSLRTASVFIINRNRVLLLLRDNTLDIPNPNMWSSIGGLVEEGESPEEAVRREALEEAGIVLGCLEHIETQTYESGRISTRFFTAISDEDAGRVHLGDEGQALRFFTFAELADIPLSGSVRMYVTERPDFFATLLENVTCMERQLAGAVIEIEDGVGCVLNVKAAEDVARGASFITVKRLVDSAVFVVSIETVRTSVAEKGIIDMLPFRDSI